MEYIRFLLDHKRLIGFGFFLTFFSSFGQTFLISLYVPHILREFDLSSVAFGTLYGTATVLSGLALAYTGRFLDRCCIRTYSLLAVSLLILSCFCLALSYSLAVVFIAFWGLRFAGQGLLSHISSTAISKFFCHRRGTALSLSVMGYSVGEACFPLVIGCLILWIGWRKSMFLNGILIGLTLVPLICIALRGIRHHDHLPSNSPQAEKPFSALRLWLDKRFCIVAANIFILPFVLTGLFFYHVVLSEEKGWSLEWLTASFLGYALGRALFSLIGGRLIDRYSALTLLPYYLAPFVGGLCALVLFDHPLAAPVYLTLAGVTMGLSSTIKTALLAELYGTQNLGSIRAMSATLMVFSTALSPALFGLSLDHGLSFTSTAAVAAAIVLLVMSISSRLPAIVRRSGRNVDSETALPDLISAAS